ncbi:hypothetical protein BDR26DRAFT_887952, partial [Obelidium mucronatum]
MTGRGLMATKRIQSGTPIISVDARFLITINTVSAYFKEYSSIDTRCLNEQAALALFLAVQRMKREEEGGNGFWNAYLDMIPKDFDTVAANLPLELQQLLPWQVRDMISKQISTFEKDFAAVMELLAGATNNGGRISLEKEDYRWAWLSFPRKSRWPQFLDLLNHSLTARIQANFNSKNNAFEIIALEDVESHDNAFLLVEYGFVVSNARKESSDDSGGDRWWVHNPYDHILVDREVAALVLPGEKKGFRARVIGELEGAGFYGDYTLHIHQDSYRLMNALRLYACASSQDDFEVLLSRWRMVVNGQIDMISSENEKAAQVLLHDICQKLLEESKHSVHLLSLFSQQYGMKC